MKTAPNKLDVIENLISVAFCVEKPPPPKNVIPIFFNWASLGLIPSALASLIAGFVLQLSLIFNIACKKQLTWQSLRLELPTSVSQQIQICPSQWLPHRVSVIGVAACVYRSVEEMEPGLELGVMREVNWVCWPEQPVPGVSCQHFAAQPFELFHISWCRRGWVFVINYPSARDAYPTAMHSTLMISFVLFVCNLSRFGPPVSFPVPLLISWVMAVSVLSHVIS